MSKDLEKLISDVETGLQKIKDYVNKPAVEVKGEIKHVERWEDLSELLGYWVNSECEIIQEFIGVPTKHYNLNVFPLERQAQSILALSQLLQLRQEFLKREGYQPNWDCVDSTRVNIWSNSNGIINTSSNYEVTFLSFPNYELAELFISLYHDLLTEYFAGM